VRNLAGGDQQVMPLADAVALLVAEATPPDLR
jgi:threonyl-tRNA synthetase